MHVLAVSACIVLTAHGRAAAWAMCCYALLASIWQWTPIKCRRKGKIFLAQLSAMLVLGPITRCLICDSAQQALYVQHFDYNIAMLAVCFALREHWQAQD